MRVNQMFLVGTVVLCLLSPTIHALSLETTVALALENNLDIKLLQSRLDEEHANLQVIIGKTDFQLGGSVSQNRTNTSVSTSGSYYVDGTALSLFLAKTFDFGLTIKAETSYNRAYYTYPNIDYGPYHVGEGRVTLSLPLLKMGDNAPVKSAVSRQQGNITIVASQLSDTMSQIVLSVAKGYWAYWGAVKKYENATYIVQRMETLAADIKRLVDAGQRARTDYDQIVAELASSSLSVTQAAREVESKKNALSLLVGVSLDGYGEPEDGIPSLKQDDLLSIDVEEGVKKALARRGDYLAVQQTARLAAMQLSQAQNDARPDLDVQVSVGWNGGHKGADSLSSFGNAFSENVQTPEFTAVVSYVSPIVNRSGKGSVSAAQAKVEQANLSVRQKTQRVAYEVKEQAQSVENAFDVMTQSQNMTHLYDVVVTAETKKLKGGYSTIENLVSVQERLVNANNTYVDTVVRFLSDVFTYKYLIGDLVDGKNLYALQGENDHGK